MPYSIGDPVRLLRDVHLEDTHIPAGTRGVVSYLLLEDPEAAGVTWKTAPPTTIEVNVKHLWPAATRRTSLRCRTCGAELCYCAAPCTCPCATGDTDARERAEGLPLGALLQTHRPARPRP